MSINRKELLAKPRWQLTCSEHAWLYPKEIATDHYNAVKAAIQEGEEIPLEVLRSYPRLAALAARLRRENKKGA